MFNAESLRAKLSKNKVDNVINELLASDLEDIEMKDTIILASREWADLKLKEMKGLEVFPESKQKIVYRLLNIITHIESLIPFPAKKEVILKREIIEKKIEQNFEETEEILKKFNETKPNLEHQKNLKRELQIQKRKQKKNIKNYEKVLITGALGVSSYSFMQLLNSDLETSDDYFTDKDSFSNYNTPYNNIFNPDAKNNDITSSEEEDDDIYDSLT